MEINLTQRSKSIIAYAIGLPICGLICWGILALLFRSPLITPQTSIQFGNTSVDKTLVLFVIVKILLFVSYVWFVIAGFKTKTHWGILNLLVPAAAIFFTINHLKKAKHPAIVWLTGVIVLILALIRAGTK